MQGGVYQINRPRFKVSLTSGQVVRPRLSTLNGPPSSHVANARNLEFEGARDLEGAAGGRLQIVSCQLSGGSCLGCR